MPLTWLRENRCTFTYLHTPPCTTTLHNHHTHTHTRTNTQMHLHTPPLTTNTHRCTFTHHPAQPPPTPPTHTQTHRCTFTHHPAHTYKDLTHHQHTHTRTDAPTLIHVQHTRTHMMHTHTTYPDLFVHQNTQTHTDTNAYTLVRFHKTACTGALSYNCMYRCAFIQLHVQVQFQSISVSLVVISGPKATPGGKDRKRADSKYNPVTRRHAGYCGVLLAL